MKRIVIAALAVSLLSGTAFAQPGSQGRYEQGRGDNDRNDNDSDNRNDNKDRRDNDSNDRGDRDNNWDRRDGNNARWSRGDRLPQQFRQTQYVVNDWRQRNLRTPPRGYYWVRSNNDFFLVQISSGLISEVVYRNDRDQNWNQRYARTYTYNDDRYYQECRNSPDPGGIAVGALIGGLLGNAAGSGNGRTGATIAGVIAGGAVGAALTNNLDCQDRGYAYKTYYDGFNSGRANTTYRWNNPGNSHRGEFRVANYYNDPSGFRCANYTQTVYVQGQPQQARGQACRQPDGAWAFVN